MNAAKLTQLAFDNGWEITSELTIRKRKLAFDGNLHFVRGPISATVQFTLGGGKMLAAGFAEDGIPQGFDLDIDQVVPFICK